MKPNSAVLMQMFGDDTPIGTYAKNSFKEELASSKTFDEVIEAIVYYSCSLYREQKNYEDISPYGGLDITVERPEETAVSTAIKVFELDKYKKMVPSSGWQPEFYKHLAKRTDLSSFKTCVDKYEDIANIVSSHYFTNTVKEVLKEREEKESNFRKMANENFYKISEKEEELEKLQNNFFAKTFNRKKIASIKTEIQGLTENLDKIEQQFLEHNEDAYCNAPWSYVLDDMDSTYPITTEAGAAAEEKRLSEYLRDKKSVYEIKKSSLLFVN